MKIVKIISCILVIALMTAFIVTKRTNNSSNAYIGFSSLSTSISYQTTK